MSLDLSTLSQALDADFDPELEEKTRVTVSIFDEYEHRSEGGLNYLLSSEIESQRTLIWSFVKEAGMHILKGGSLTQIALPVALSEPKSFLQRIALEFAGAPTFLHQAADSQDPVQRLQQVVAFVVGGLWRPCLGQKKPFNPILGETYQAKFFDGTRVFMEQTSHHPPVSAWDVEAPGRWRMFGFGEGTANVSGNAVKCTRKGKNAVQFADGTKIEWTLPILQVGGLMWGGRTMEYLGEITFVDALNGLEAVLKFDSESKAGGWFGGGKSMPTDLFRGALIDKKASAEVASFHGSWLEQLVVTDARTGAETVLWDMSSNRGYDVVPIEAPLPSDCSHREDMRALQTGDLAFAQTEKERLEQLQRADKHLRKAAGHAH